ncbi:hypothetical protein DPEC_G00344060 [Dallia pectoralis]|uniref:Uncharacterized protein n=1 Tax=Dallia pectoralis TaxID=75939 RepID=A0ACC2F354_DALPE|nr:hypothetical protein DPEC_G00344060 [Dallia pectoralis]
MSSPTSAPSLSPGPIGPAATRRQRGLPPGPDDKSDHIAGCQGWEPEDTPPEPSSPLSPGRAHVHLSPALIDDTSFARSLQIETRQEQHTSLPMFRGKGLRVSPAPRLRQAPIL